jgi:preprotein translocase subunit SecA
MRAFFEKVLGLGPERAIGKIQPIVKKINDLEPTFRELSDEQLGAKTAEFRERLEQGETLDDLLPEAFAAVREASRRTNGQRHYDVQLIGGIVLHQGKIAEMRTGEGKTLVATLPLYLNALEGMGCHLITVNDYLARVGAGWMGPIYTMLGLTVSVISHDYSAIFDPNFVDPKADQEDQRLVHWRPCTRREAYMADITYGTNNEFGFDYLRDNMAIDEMHLAQRELHYAIVDEVDNILIDEARTPLIISGPAQQSSDEYRRFATLVRNLKPSSYTPDQVKREMIDPDGDFMIDPRSKSIQLTDAGIQAVERLLRIPHDESLYDPKYYTLTHYLDNAMRAQFIYHRDRDYIIEPNGEVVIVDEFTGRKMPGRRWSDGLHQAVEAKEGVQLRQENVTMATITFQNFFRMYKKLAGMTGTAFTEREEFGKIYNLDIIPIPTHRPMVRKDLDDQIYRTEAAKFHAVAREVVEVHATGRPVLIGTTSVETSERLSKILSQQGVKHNVLNAKFHEREARIVSQAGRKGSVTIATNMAGRGTDILLGGNPDGLVEEILEARGLTFEDATPEDRRAALEEARRITSAEGNEIKELGGLHIIGTERHESRRIDNQLRGRAGRQGDPGSSRFYLSLEDDLMRRFGPMDRVKGLMSRLGVDDDVPIEAGLINRSIEGAQTRVEGYNFDIRKHTVEFDDVMNKQRTIIYADRRAILEGQDIRDRILEMIDDEIATLAERFLPPSSGAEEPEWDFEGLLRAYRVINPIVAVEIEELETLSRDEIIETLRAAVEEAYELREQAIGEENMRYVERRMMLGAIDRQWIDYLTGMEDLRQEIGLQAIAQRDPLIEYQRNAFQMFDELKANIQRDIVYQIVAVSTQYEQRMRQIEAEQQQRMLVAQRAGVPVEQVRNTRTVRNAVQLPGRNDPCPCGSGKKFKACHLGREAELIALLQAGGGAAAPAAPQPSVTTQLAGGTQQPTPRGRQAPAPQQPADPPGNNKQQVRRGRGAPSKRK